MKLLKKLKMKKSLWLALILLATSSAFSQSDTENRFTEKFREADAAFNKVVLDSITAHKVIVDLITGDAAIQENETLAAIIETQKEELSLSYETIVDMQANRADLELATKQYQDIIKEQDNSLDYKDAELKKQKNKTLLYQITTVAAILGGGYLLIK